MRNSAHQFICAISCYREVAKEEKESTKMYIVERETFLRVLNDSQRVVVDARKFRLFRGQFKATSNGVKMTLDEWRSVLDAAEAVRKAIKMEAVDDTDEAETFIEVDSEDFLRLSVKMFKGMKYVHVRRYFRTEDDQLLPTRQGITLTGEGYESLVGRKDIIKGDIEAIQSLF